MDKKKTGATASSHTEKHSTEKKDENFLSKTAHSIREKVHELADDVKEKTHHLTHSGDPKKSGKSTSDKKTASGKAGGLSGSDDKDSESDDNHKNKGPKSPTKGTKREQNLRTNPSSTSQSPSPANSASATTKRDGATTNPSKSPAAQNLSTDRTRGSATDQKETSTTVRPSSAPSKPATTTTTEPKKEATISKSADQIHLSFSGIITVDDLLDRIDEAIEHAKIFVEDNKGNIGVTLEQGSYSSNNTQTIKKDHKNDGNSQEPIDLNYNDIHTIEDLLTKVNNQPGDRKVLLSNAPKKSSISATHEPSVTSKTVTINEDSSTGQKNILKTSQDPSLLDTSTKVSSLGDDKIHVDVSGISSVDDLLNRIEDTAQKVPLIIEPTSPEAELSKTDSLKKDSAASQNSTKQTMTATSSAVPKQREEQVPVSQLVENKLEGERNPKTSTTTSNEEKETTEWI